MKGYEEIMKKIINGFIALSLMLLCNGCQKKAQNNIIHNDKEETINLKFYGYKTEAINVVAIEESLQSYMKKHPNIKITYESVKGVEYYNILEKRLNSENSDDIYMIDEDHLQQYKGKGYFEDLSDLSTIKSFSDTSLEQMKEKNGEIYYVPTSISAFGLYCNLDILKAHNQKVPQNEKEFFDVCQYFVDQGIMPIIANNDISLKTIAIGKALYPVYHSDQSQSIIDKINHDPELLCDYMKEGYAYVKMLIDKDFINAKETLKTEKTKDDLIQFEKGENPFMLTGAWAAIRIQEDAPDLNFEVHPYPIMENGSILISNIDTRLCVSAKGKNIEEAKKFIEYMTQEDFMWQFVNSQSSFSPLKKSQLSDNKAILPLSTYFNKEKSIYGSDSRLNYPIWSLTRVGIQELLKGESIESALKNIKEFNP